MAVGLGLRLPKLPMGLAKPLLARGEPPKGAGATMETSLVLGADARMAAAESSTEGTECSICSVVLERGMRWGSVGWWWL